MEDHEPGRERYGTVGAVSCLFEIGDTVLWNPSNTVACIFKGEAEAIASAFHVASGLGDIIEDQCEVDLPAFEKFLAEAMRQYHQTAHPILRSLMTGFIATALVLAERAGGRLTETTPEQAAAWARLRQEHARSMSR